MDQSVCETCHQIYNPKLIALWHQLNSLDEQHGVVEETIDTVVRRMQLKHSKRAYARQMLQAFYNELCKKCNYKSELT